jgi:malto-oligosyltrehalose trehalohydrolase
MTSTENSDRSRPYTFELGAIPQGANRCGFRVWAPRASKVEVHLISPIDRLMPLQRDERGYHSGVVDDVPCGADYLFRLDDDHERPDPASRWQPGGVHGPSRVVDPWFEWMDSGWPGLPLKDYIIYELHVGTFDQAGTFDGVIAHLAELKELGITAIELMPVAQFPGTRNWGYDGVYPFAVQDSYGGPAGLKRLVNAAHREGLAVVLDVVYNHLGPEGNYLGQFAPYFTDRYRTPWGAALNFDGPESDEVRRYFTENALYWIAEFHMDALRLDAVHAIRDFSAVPFLEELAEACHREAEARHRHIHVIAESDLNMARHILPRDLGGYGMDAQWSDDFHHCLHVLLTGERAGYYGDYGEVDQMAKVWREGYAFTGEPSRYRRRRHGSSPRRNPVKQFVVCGQNHDQIGNRRLGDRWSATDISISRRARTPGSRRSSCRIRPIRITTGTSASPPSATRPMRLPRRILDGGRTHRVTSSTTTRASASTSARRCSPGWRKARTCYAAILEADRAAASRFGGTATAWPRRTITSSCRWPIRATSDAGALGHPRFRAPLRPPARGHVAAGNGRRTPPTLEVLAEHGIASPFSPHQAQPCAPLNRRHGAGAT